MNLKLYKPKIASMIFIIATFLCNPFTGAYAACTDTDSDTICDSTDTDDDGDGVSDDSEGQSTIQFKVSGSTRSINGDSSGDGTNVDVVVGDEIRYSNVTTVDGTALDVLVTILAIENSPDRVTVKSSGSIEIRGAASTDAFARYKVEFVQAGTNTVFSTITGPTLLEISDIDSQDTRDLVEVFGADSPDDFILGADLESGGFVNSPATLPPAGFDYVRLKPSLLGNPSDWTDEINVVGSSAATAVNFLFNGFGAREFVVGSTGSYGTAQSRSFSYLKFTITVGTDSNSNGTYDHVDPCYPSDIVAVCDSDSDGTPDGYDAHPNDPTKTAPVITLPSAPAVTEDDTDVPIADDVDLSDSDGDNQTVTLTITGGTVSISATGLTFTTGDGSDDALMVFSGTLADINTALDAMTFTPTANLSGTNAGAIRIQTDDGNSATDDETLQFDITGENDAPVITLPTAPSVTENDTDVAIADVVNIADLDGDSQTVTLTITGGTATIGSTGLTFTTGDGADDTLMAFSGTLADINTALDAMTFTPTANLSGTNAGAIRIQTDDGNSATDDETLQFDIADGNDAPVITLPTAPSVTENDTDVAIADDVNIADLNGDSQTVTLTITGGSASIGSAGLTFTTGDGTGDALMAFSGSLADINTALDAMTFTPTANLNGTNAGGIRIQTDDGRSGTDDETVRFDIAGVPVISIGTVATDDIINQTEDDSAVTISGSTINVEDGQTVTVQVNGIVYTDTVTGSSWSVSMSAAEASALDASETVKADVTNASGRPASQASRAITHTLVLPTIGIDVIANDDVINLTEDNSAVSISGNTSSVEDGQIVTVTLNGETYTAPVASGVWSVSVPAADAQALGSSETVTANVANLAGDNAPQATRDLSHTVNLPTINIDSIAADDIISATEDDNDVTVSGTTSNVEDNQTVTVVVNGKNYTTTVAGGSWSVVMPASDAQALGSSESVTADVSNAAGDSATQASRTIEHVVNTPLITIDAVAGDDVINAVEDDSDVTISGTTLNVQDNQTVTIEVNTVIYTAQVANNSWSVVMPAADAQALDASEVVTADVANSVGDNAPQASRSIEHTVDLPTIAIETIAGDDIINANEDDADILITGTTSYVEDGQTVTVGINNKNYNATVNGNAWSVTLPASDAQALPANNGVTADVSNAAGDTANQAMRTLGHSVDTPLVTIDVVAGDDVVNATEDDASVTISGTTQNVEDGQTVTATVNGVTYTATVTAAQWSVLMSAAEAQALEATETVTADVSNVAGDIAPQASRIIAHTINLPEININAISGDDVISAAEDDSPVTVSGTTVNVEDGQTVTAQINGVNYTAIVASNAWSFDIPAADAQALPASETVVANVTNLAGDTAPQATRDISHSLTLPVVTIDVIADDDRISALEDDADIRFFGSATNVEDGQQVSIEVNGVTYSAAVSSSAWEFLMPAADAQALDATELVTANVSNLAGDAAQEASRTVAHTVLLPEITISLIAEDDVIDSDEDDSSVSIAGTTTNVEDGQQVTVMLNGNSYMPTVTGGNWSIVLSVTDVEALATSETVLADVTNAAGDIAPQASRDITRNTFDPAADDDVDGVPNILDGLNDSDGDGIANYLDPDSDNDSIPDGVEAEIAGVDSNGNGIDDAFDAEVLLAPDSDDDGLADGVLPVDTDGDSIADFLDLDSDNDAIPDAIEVGADTSNPSDSDGDGVADFRDLDSDGDRIADNIEMDSSPALPPDTDRDGKADFLDIDSDNDGILDTLESTNIPAPLNIDANGNGLDDSIDAAMTGGDDDNANGVDDSYEPLNTDGDDLPDYLDLDSDGDGISDEDENQAAYAEPTADSDANGLIDSLDVSLTLGADVNENGIDDAFEATDTDDDGTPDFQDLDSDNDTLPDVFEGDVDTDGDGQGNFRDIDSDADLLSDTLEAGNDPTMPRNSDDDFEPDYIDLDSDNDNLLDSVESNLGALLDSDDDGVPNHRDRDTDNDGIADLDEMAAVINKDTDGDGIPDRFDADANSDGALDSGKQDDDGDDIEDAVDAEVNGMQRPDLDGNGIVDTANLADSDGDGTPDVIDIDSDNDGLPDLDEVGGFYRDLDGDGRIDGEDLNGNGLIDDVDDALGQTLLAHVDTDGDGRPDALDLDSDGDGLTDLSEAGLTAVDPDGDGIVGTGSFADNNANGLGDLADPVVGGDRADFIDRDFDGVPDTRSLDSDGDGISDLIEAAGNSAAEIIDPDGDGKAGSPDAVLIDNNDNGIADELEGVNNVEARSRIDEDEDGVPDVAEEYLQSILVEPPAQAADPETGMVAADQADFDRDGYPDAIEVRYGGDPLNGAEDDSDGDGVPDWVEQTDIDGDGSNDSDNDGFNDLLELVIGTDFMSADSQDDLFDAAESYLFSQNRYEGRSVKPVIWVDIAQGGDEAINVAADAGAVTLTGRIGNYHVFGDPRDSRTVPVYSWASEVGSLADAIIGTTDTATLTFDPSMLNPGLYTVVLSVILAEHESVTEQIIEVVATGALRDSDADRHPDNVDDRNADIGYLRTVQTTGGRYLNADSPVVVDGEDFSDKAVRLRAGQLAQANRALGIALTQDELDTAVQSLVDRGYSAADSQDEGYIYEHIYDYEVINLPFVGASARIVIPLNTPVPEGAVLRKYAPLTGWQDFVLSDTDTRATAPWLNGEQGVCPEPGSNAYTMGLNAGDNCLQLQIIDGGLNDGENDDANSEDGQGDINGLIKDPIAIGTLATPVTGEPAGRIETGLRGGGGSFDLSALLALLLSVLLIRHRSLNVASPKARN